MPWVCSEPATAGHGGAGPERCSALQTLSLGQGVQSQLCGPCALTPARTAKPDVLMQVPRSSHHSRKSVQQQLQAADLTASLPEKNVSLHSQELLLLPLTNQCRETFKNVNRLIY